MDKEDSETLKHISATLDEINDSFKFMSQPTPVLSKVFNGFATGAGILGILGAVEVVRTWIIGG